MTFPYYNRLSSRQKAIYRQSDAVGEIRLPDPPALHPLVGALRAALVEDSRPQVTRAVQSLSRELLAQLKVPPLTVKVLAVRPSRSWGELHGLYTSGEASPAEVRVWMRTARHRRVVAFRTFLRTLLHELCHHLDYHVLELADSYHTEGFFRRESSLFRQLAPTTPPPRGAAPPVRSAPLDRERASGAASVSHADPSRRKPSAPPEDERQGRLPFDTETD
jgi:hypothetical protein